MSEQNNKFGKYPKNALIEDVAKDFLDSDKLKSLLDFLEFLKNNKLTPRRASSSNWVVKYKGKNVCNLKLKVEEPFWSPALINCTIKDWKLTFGHFASETWFAYYDKYFSDKGITQFIWDIIQKPRCPRNCQNKVTVLGKEFFPVCFCELFSVTNPSGVESDYSQKLILIIKTYIADCMETKK